MIRSTIARLRVAFATHRPDDVRLNQPGRALGRAALWWMTALAFALYPLGAIAGYVARIDGLEYVFANLAGLFLSGILTQLLLIVVGAVIMAAFPVLSASHVPRPPTR